MRARPQSLPFDLAAPAPSPAARRVYLALTCACAPLCALAGAVSSRCIVCVCVCFVPPSFRPQTCLLLFISPTTTLTPHTPHFLLLLLLHVSSLPPPCFGAQAPPLTRRPPSLAPRRNPDGVRSALLHAPPADQSFSRSTDDESCARRPPPLRLWLAVPTPFNSDTHTHTRERACTGSWPYALLAPYYHTPHTSTSSPPQLTTHPPLCPRTCPVRA